MEQNISQQFSMNEKCLYFLVNVTIMQSPANYNAALKISGQHFFY